MTRIERSLTKAGITMDSVTINSAKEIEVAVMQDGECAFDETDKLASEISKALGFGGYRCAWGGWVLLAGYASQGDFTDCSSCWHY